MSLLRESETALERLVTLDKRLNQELLDNVATDVCQSKVATLKAKRKCQVVQAHEVENRGL